MARDGGVLAGTAAILEKSWPDPAQPENACYRYIFWRTGKKVFIDMALSVYDCQKIKFFHEFSELLKKFLRNISESISHPY